MTMTSIAPLSVAGLMLFHVLETEPLMLRTYCIAPDGVKHPERRLSYSNPGSKWPSECRFFDGKEDRQEEGKKTGR